MKTLNKERLNPLIRGWDYDINMPGFLEWLTIGRDAEEILVLEPRKFLTDNDTVAVVGFTRCLAKPTGKSYETDFVHLVTLREGKVIRFQEFFDTFVAAEAFRK